MAASAYLELLRDPRWQRKRLEIMQRDGFACQACGDKTKTLNVHHKVYHRGAKPWEYEPSDLVTLCEECHEDGHEKSRTPRDGKSVYVCSKDGCNNSIGPGEGICQPCAEEDGSWSWRQRQRGLVDG